MVLIHSCPGEGHAFEERGSAPQYAFSRVDFQPAAGFEDAFCVGVGAASLFRQERGGQEFEDEEVEAPVGDEGGRERFSEVGDEVGGASFRDVDVVGGAGAVVWVGVVLVPGRSRELDPVALDFVLRCPVPPDDAGGAAEARDVACHEGGFLLDGSGRKVGSRMR